MLINTSKVVLKVLKSVAFSSLSSVKLVNTEYLPGIICKTASPSLLKSACFKLYSPAFVVSGLKVTSAYFGVPSLHPLSWSTVKQTETFTETNSRLVVRLMLWLVMKEVTFQSSIGVMLYSAFFAVKSYSPPTKSKENPPKALTSDSHSIPFTSVAITIGVKPS